MGEWAGGSVAGGGVVGCLCVCVGGGGVFPGNLTSHVID